MDLKEHILATYDVKLVGPSAEVDRYRRDMARVQNTLRWIADCPTLPHETEESMVAVFRKAAAGALGMDTPRDR